MAVRDASLDETEHFRAVERLLRETSPAVRRGQLDSIAVPTGRLFRAGSGALRVRSDLNVLSSDDVWTRARRRSREPDPTELARWRLVSECIEKGAPALSRGGRLVELMIPYGVLRVQPDGGLVCLEESEPTELVSVTWDPEPLPDPRPEPEPDVIDAPLPPILPGSFESDEIHVPGDDELVIDPPQMATEGRRDGTETAKGGIASYRTSLALRKVQRHRSKSGKCPLCRGPCVAPEFLPVAKLAQGRGRIIDLHGSRQLKVTAQTFLENPVPRTFAEVSVIEREIALTNRIIAAGRRKIEASQRRVAALDIGVSARKLEAGVVDAGFIDARSEEREIKRRAEALLDRASPPAEPPGPGLLWERIRGVWTAVPQSRTGDEEALLRAPEYQNQ